MIPERKPIERRPQPEDSTLAQHRLAAKQEELDANRKQDYEVSRGGTRWRKKSPKETPEEGADPERDQLIADIIEQLGLLLPSEDEIIRIIKATIPQEFHDSPVMVDSDASTDPVLKAGLQQNDPSALYLGQALPSRAGKSKYMVLSLSDDALTIDWDWVRFHT